MKTKIITALVLATGFLTTAALADDSFFASDSVSTETTAPTPSLNQVTFTSQTSRIADLASAMAARGWAFTRVAHFVNELSVANQADFWQTKPVSYQLLHHLTGSPDHSAAPMAIFANPPSSLDYDRFDTAFREPAVSLRISFAFGRGNRS